MGKTALVTGASNGIGYELSRIHAEKGGDLILVARSKDKMVELKTELEETHGVKVFIIGKDLSVPGSAREVYEAVKDMGLTVDFLVNNAGFGDYGMFVDSDWEKQERMINLNITTLAHLTWLYLPEMINRRSGKILNLASTASFQPGPTMSVYFASKAFVLNFSEAINNEVNEFGVTVTALCPGATQSGFQSAAAMSESKLFDGNNFPTSREVAEYGYRAMEKGKAVAIHGFKNALMANAVRFAPRSVVVKAARKVQAKNY
ncbi:MAG TPA: SDR family oxidoreductase [Bacteroidales bacterium]|nr:SDR family oxidoreductase [Bacteroidales bacterium]